MATLSELVSKTTEIKNDLATCHAKLKTNLTGKGVTVSSSDKMLTLVNKINDIKVGADINVKVKSSLPSSATEGDYVIITSETYNKLFISKTEPRLSEKDIWFSVTDDIECTIQESDIDILGRGVDAFIKLNGVNRRLDLYKYTSGKFNKVNGFFVIYEAPNYYNTDLTGGMVSSSDTNAAAGTDKKTDTNQGIQISLLRSDTGWTTRVLATNNKVDLTNYKTLQVTFKVLQTSTSKNYVEFFSGVSDSKTGGGRVSLRNSYAAYNSHDLAGKKNMVITDELNISNLTGNQYVKIALHVGGAISGEILIQSIKLLP